MREKTTIQTLLSYKQSGQGISMLTCYDYATATALEAAEIDTILVGDSLASVLLGYRSTIPADMDLMIALSLAVRKGAPSAYLIGDMPFLSYQPSIEHAMLNAGRFLKEAQCDAVKLEVTYYHEPIVKALSEAGISVMAHIGLRPQHIDKIGQYKCHGKTISQAREIIEDAKRMEAAGATSLLLEAVTTEVAQKVTERSTIPVISCGSGPTCDGQVLVIHDLLGLPGGRNAKFVKQYGQIGQQMTSCVKQYIKDVATKSFPAAEHCYHMEKADKAQLENL